LEKEQKIFWMLRDGKKEMKLLLIKRFSENMNDIEAPANLSGVESEHVNAVLNLKRKYVA